MDREKFTKESKTKDENLLSRSGRVMRSIDDEEYESKWVDKFEPYFFLLWQYGLSSFQERENGILLPKLFWPTMRKKCSSDRENILKFEGQEF